MKELNTGWAEWQAEELPTHGGENVPTGTIRCSCSLHADAVGEAEAGAAPH